MKLRSVSFIRNFIFGVEDSLVSTVGLLSGIAIADVPGKTIFLTGVVLIFVEAFSMAVGSFLSERSAQEYALQAPVTVGAPVAGGVIMFFSYFVSGFIPLAPYIIFPVETAFPCSIIASLVALFALGLVSARLAKTRLMHSALRILIIGGSAIGIGILAGKLVH